MKDTLVASPDWGADASCLNMDLELFFPTTQVGWQGEVRSGITKMCHECKVYEQCLDYALRVEVDGVWAGTSPWERKFMRRRLGITAMSIESTMGLGE